MGERSAEWYFGSRVENGIGSGKHFARTEQRVWMISREMVASFSCMKDLVVRLRRWSLKRSLGRRYVSMSSKSSEGRSRNDCGLGAGFFLDFFCKRFCIRSVFFEWSCSAAVVSTRGSSLSLSAVVVFFLGRFPTVWTECEVTMWYISSLLSVRACTVVGSLLDSGAVIVCSGSRFP